MNQNAEQANPWVTQATAETFARDVVDRSRQVPVVVDFWADWCAPCRMLAPILEKLAADYAGRFVLVKVDTETAPEVAAQFGVQSIPSVFAVIDGEVVDMFQGSLPENQIRGWIERVLQTASRSQAQVREQEDPQAAEALYRELVQQNPNDSLAAIGLARCLLRQHRDEEARQLVERLEQRGFLEPEAEEVKAALSLRGNQQLDPAACERACREHPEDLTLQLRYAEALAGAAQYRRALEKRPANSWWTSFAQQPPMKIWLGNFAASCRWRCTDAVHVPKSGWLGIGTSALPVNGSLRRSWAVRR
jgi:putative thioredoxin